jgi:hypothetical protein
MAESTLVWHNIQPGCLHGHGFEKGQSFVLTTTTLTSLEKFMADFEKKYANGMNAKKRKRYTNALNTVKQSWSRKLGKEEPPVKPSRSSGAASPKRPKYRVYDDDASSDSTTNDQDFFTLAAVCSSQSESPCGEDLERPEETARRRMNISLLID